MTPTPEREEAARKLVVRLRPEMSMGFSTEHLAVVVSAFLAARDAEVIARTEARWIEKIKDLAEEEDCCALHHHEGNLCCLKEAGLRSMAEDIVAELHTSSDWLAQHDAALMAPWVEAVKDAEHELTTLHNLDVSDDPERLFRNPFVIDTSGVRAKLRALLSSPAVSAKEVKPYPGVHAVIEFYKSVNAPSAREKALEAVVGAARKARSGGPYTPMFEALDELAAFDLPVTDKEEREALEWVDRVYDDPQSEWERFSRILARALRAKTAQCDARIKELEGKEP